MSATDAPEAAPVSPEREEELLGLIDPLRDRLEALDAERAAVLAERAAVFLRIREEAPKVSMKRIAGRAGVSDAAVVQQVERARQARETAAGS